MTLWQGLGSLANKIWNELFSIQIPFIGLSGKQLLIGIFCVTVGIAVFRRIFQSAMARAAESSASDRANGSYKERKESEKSERENKNKKISSKRRNDER